MVLLSPPVLGAKAEAKRAELKDLQSRIQALQQEIGRAEDSKGDVADQLKDTERGISEANRRLHDLGEQKAELEQGLTVLTAQSRGLESRIAKRQEQLEKLIYKRYVSGENGALRHLLSGQNPDQLARDQYYLAALSKAQAELIRDLNGSLEEKQRLADEGRQKRAELSEIERRQEAERRQLLEEKKKRQMVLARIADRISGQRREVERLRRDEKRLARLIEGLSRIVRKPTPAARAPSSRTPPDRPVLRNDRVPEESPDTDFARLKGKLHLPARGELAGRFGTPRHDGGGNWKGVFIRAASGEVKAIAAGRVVFADWLRGFGNLIIVDHGDSYLSVYGNNESLLKQVGQPVKGGDPIAVVGSSGGSAETGLYFELRHQGQPLDPMRWVTIR